MCRWCRPRVPPLGPALQDAEGLLRIRRADRAEQWPTRIPGRGRGRGISDRASDDPAGAVDTASVVRRALIQALGLPSLVLLTSMMGFGALARESGFGFWMAVVTTAGVWGLPGQLVLAELYAAGAETAAVVMASSLANARFLPMAVAFLPMMRRGLKRRAWLFGLVQLMSINTWAAALREGPGLSGRHRRLYYLLFAGVCLTAAVIGTAIGYQTGDVLPRPVTVGLVYLNPIFFALLFAGMRGRMIAYALIIGAVTGPLLHLVSPDWGVLATGLVAGTVAFFAFRATKGRA